MNKEYLTKMLSNCSIDGEKVLVKDNFKDVINFLQNEYQFDVLKQIIVKDNKEKGIELIYQLYSTDNEEDLLLSQTVFGEADTVTDIYKSAIADENEIYDLFGVKFLGNENLKRLYMPEDWEGHPLRKDDIQDDSRLA